MKKLLAIMLAISLLILGIAAYADTEEDITREEDNTSTDVFADISVNAKSAVLMEAKTGKVLFSQNEDYYNSPASVTKIMTLLLVCEALDEGKFRLEDEVSISEYASSMGGSQVFLKEGERLTVEELIKCTVIASANDAAVALAELTEGSEEAFVNKMNKKATELGLKKTSFENVTGLDDTTVNHYTSALDIAVMSRELIKYPIITKYSSLWQDSIRDGEFILTNTNRLVRFYQGCNGLKTGSTDKAGYCISVSAKRGNLELIAVIMNSESITERNNAARTLLDFGFANYALYEQSERFLEKVPVYSGTKDTTDAYSKEFVSVVPKSDINKIECIYNIPENISAPCKKGDKIGTVSYKIGDTVIGESEIYAGADIERITIFGLFAKIVRGIFA